MLTPEEVESRQFLVSLRGYDRDEVGAFLSEVAQRMRQLEAELETAQAQAQEAARQPTSQPTPTAEPTPVAATAENLFAQLGRETQRILETAQEAGEEIKRTARQEGERELQTARSESARVIAEGERRREQIEQVVAQLAAQQEQLAASLENTGRHIQQVLRELGPGGAPTASVREALATETAEDAAAEAAFAAPPVEPLETYEPVDPVESDPAATPIDPLDTPVDPVEPAEPVDAAEPIEPVEPPEGGPDEDAAAEDVDEVVAGGPLTEAADAAEGAAEPETAGLLDREEPQTAPEPMSTPPAAETPADAAADAMGEPPQHGEPIETADTVVAPSGEDPQTLRATMLSPLHPKLVRSVKRSLQELQNMVLDDFRRAKAEGEPEQFTPSEDDLEPLLEGASTLLDQAYDAGLEAGGRLLGRELPSPALKRDLLGGFRADLHRSLDQGLAGSLRVGMSAGEDATALTDRVAGAFGDLKNQRAEELAANHLIRVYEQAMLDAWSVGGVEQRDWVMGREPRCPEARCRRNGEIGPVAVADQFPSGHAAPPVHVGCTCTTVPVA